jgi:hypothetical protein
MFLLNILLLVISVICVQKYFYENNIKLVAVWAGLLGWNLHSILF